MFLVYIFRKSRHSLLYFIDLAIFVLHINYTNYNTHVYYWPNTKTKIFTKKKDPTQIKNKYPMQVFCAFHNILLTFFLGNRATRIKLKRMVHSEVTYFILKTVIKILH